MKPFGWAFIGSGWIAEKVASEMVKEKCGRIVSVYSKTKKHAEAFAEKYGGKAYSYLEAALLAPGVQGVYIALPHNLHAEFARYAIALNLPVLCEKPFAVNEGQAREMFSLARERGVYISEAMWTWHNSTSLKVKDWVRGGDCGKITGMSGSYGYPLVYLSRNPRLTSPELIGGALMDIGVYPIRYAYELFGMPQAVKCTGRIKGGVDYGEEIELSYGAFNVSLSVAMDRFLGETVTVFGDRGRVVVPNHHAATRASLISDGKKEVFRGEKRLYARQMRQVAAEIRAGMLTGGFCPESATMDTMHLLDECRRQLGVVYPCER